MTAGQSPSRIDGVLDLRKPGRQSACEALPGRGQFNASMQTPKQRPTELALQRAHVPADRGLGDVQLPCGIGEAQPPCCRLESSQCE
jgi:hypothetical protein